MSNFLSKLTSVNIKKQTLFGLIFNGTKLVLSNEQKDKISFRNLIGNNTKLAKQNKSPLMR